MPIGEAFEINPKVSIKRGTEVPFISMDRLEPGRRDVNAVETRSYSSGSKFKPGDTLMARITPCLENGKIARYLPKGEPMPAAGSTEFMVLRGHPGITKTEFAYYFAIDPAIHDLAVSLMTGTSGRQRVDVRAFAETEVRIPNLETQRAISSILGSLDDKIAANQTAVSTGTELLMSLYRRVQKHSAEPFGRVCDVFGGSTPSTKVGEYWGGNINWATPTDLTALRGPWLSETERKITEAGLESMSSALHPPGSILMTSRATIGHVAVAATPVTTNQGFIVIRASEKLTPWIFCQLQDRVREFEAWSNGATFLEISRGNFKKLPFYRAEPQDLAEFNEKAKPLLDMSKAKQAENIALAKTRDELLPLLMSGKITVREASQEAAAAGAPIPSEEDEV